MMLLDIVEGRLLDVGTMPRLLAAAAGRARPFIMLAMNTGIAKGDLLGLNRRDVDTRTRSLAFLNSRSGRRVAVRLSRVVSDVLAGLLTSRDSALVFPPYCYSASWLDSQLDAAARRAGVRGLEFDEMPFNWAWWAALEGVRPQVIADVLGISLRAASRWCSDWRMGSRPKPVHYVVLGIAEPRPAGIVVPFRPRPTAGPA